MPSLTSIEESFGTCPTGVNHCYSYFIPFDEFQDRTLELLNGIADARPKSVSFKMDSVL